jgi:hypothetical protein
MPIQAARNLFAGVNPHLNSLLQTPGTPDLISLWEGFHAAHIGYLADTLNQTLPSTYYAVSEQSQQSTEDPYFSSIVIREQQSGDVVTRLELLSPANKPGYAAYHAYRQKRIETLLTGVPLVEIDYLHETSPIQDRVPVYPDDADACAYNV